MILYGPVGVGKSHVAQALGHLAIRPGADVRFLKTSRPLAAPRRRSRRPQLGPPAPRTYPPRRAHPRRLRHPRTHRPPGRRPLRAGQLTSRRRTQSHPHLQPLPSRLVPAVPQPGRRRITPRPADQHQPPSLHERAQLPAEQAPRPGPRHQPRRQGQRSDHPGEYRYRLPAAMPRAPQLPAATMPAVPCPNLVHVNLTSRGQPRRYCSTRCRVAEHRRLHQ